jgi:hypothetical protein
MKKSLLLTTILGLGLMSCKKENTGSSENATPKINSLQMDETKSYTFLATNDERANISFQNEGNDYTIIIKANNMMYVLDRKDADTAAIVFERNGVSAKLTKDSLLIMQGDRTIPLVRTN